MNEREHDLNRFLQALPIPAYIFAYRRPGFLAANDLFCELLGYAEDELLTPPWHKLLPLDERAAAEVAIAAARSGTFPSVPIRWRFQNTRAAASLPAQLGSAT
ncbi:MAG: hypothetical protein NVS9B15_24730 [Acidobacteriaceae bacterium]